MAVVLYGVPIFEAIAKGNLREMKKLAAQAERQVQQWGDLSSSLSALKIEIAKLEYQRGAGKRK